TLHGDCRLNGAHDGRAICHLFTNVRLTFRCLRICFTNHGGETTLSLKEKALCFINWCQLWWFSWALSPRDFRRPPQLSLSLARVSRTWMATWSPTRRATRPSKWIRIH